MIDLPGVAGDLISVWGQSVREFEASRSQCPATTRVVPGRDCL